MIIIPAIDIKNGKCVRLLQGRMDKQTVYSEDPCEVAKKWVEEGALLLHVVDLDGAIAKKPVNLNIIAKIADKAGVPVQLGGGIRNINTADEIFNIGVSRIIIGTEAIKNPEFVKQACKKYPGKIIIGIDAKDGIAAIEGWRKSTDITAVELAKRFENFEIAAIIFTDISRDGMQTGPNIETTRILAESVSTPIIASGGVSDINDIKKLLLLEKSGVTGIITGRALYERALNLKEAIKTASS